MESFSQRDPLTPFSTPEVGAAAQTKRLEWVDVDRRTWHIELEPQRIVLRHDDHVLALPDDHWEKDIYMTELGQGYLVRIETFDCAVQFCLSPQQAAPWIDHLRAAGQVGASSSAHVADAGHVDPLPPQAKEEPRRVVSLLWPKVSPLAVWALICSSLVFIPIWGLLPAMATVLLLVLHRRTVRHVPAWSHSRTLCKTAFVFLVVGLFVSFLALWSMQQPVASASSTFAEPATTGQEGLNWGLIAGGLFVVLLSLSVHEAAHATTAWWLGDGYARSLGRVTLSPLAHIDPFGTVLLPLLLVMAGGPVFGYARPVPVRVESLPGYRRAHILISLAGPGSNLLLAAASLMLLIGVSCLLHIMVPAAHVTDLATMRFDVPVTTTGFALASTFGAFCTILKLSFIINMVLAMFNLIPIPPLDGSWVLEHLFPRRFGSFYASIRPYGFLIFVGAFYIGLFNYLLIPVDIVLTSGFHLLSTALGT